MKRYRVYKRHLALLMPKTVERVRAKLLLERRGGSVLKEWILTGNGDVALYFDPRPPHRLIGTARQ